MSLTFTEELLCVMTMKNDAKFEEKLTCRFKIDMGNLTNKRRPLFPDYPFLVTMCGLT